MDISSEDANCFAYINMQIQFALSTKKTASSVLWVFSFHGKSREEKEIAICCVACARYLTHALIFQALLKFFLGRQKQIKSLDKKKF